MRIKSFNSTYNLVEFHHYVNIVENKYSNVLELLIDVPIDEFYEKDLSTIFAIETDNLTHVFSDFTVNEYYEENGLVKVICVK